jgi:amino acid transporter
MGLLPLVATGICSMIGAAINIIPFSIQRSVPGIGPWVLPAYLLAAVPAVLAALAYAMLASAMPRAGGSYVYASRGIGPYLGFVASFSQWFGLSIAIGVVSYVLVPFLRDIALALNWRDMATTFDRGPVRLAIALGFLWTFVGVNLRGLTAYQWTLVPLMFLMFALGGIVIGAGFGHTQADFAAALLTRDGVTLPPTPEAPFALGTVLSASALLFASFIGFDSIAQAGGEARNPNRTLPLAIGIAIVTVGTFYVLFTAAVYHAVPWPYVAAAAQRTDVTAPGLLGYLLSPAWTLAIVGGAAVALTNDLPAMLLAVSRLMFAWAEDGVFPRAVARIHPTRRTPQVAILLSALMATVGILGSHFAGDFFLGVDVLVTSMLVNFLLMCVSVLTLPRRNPGLDAQVRVVRGRGLRVTVALAGLVMLGLFLGVHVWKDVAGPARAWYFRSTPVWVIVMAIASLVYVREVSRLRRRGVDVNAIFRELPPG